MTSMDSHKVSSSITKPAKRVFSEPVLCYVLHFYLPSGSIFRAAVIVKRLSTRVQIAMLSTDTARIDEYASLDEKVC